MSVIPSAMLPELKSMLEDFAYPELLQSIDEDLDSTWQDVHDLIEGCD